VALGPHFRRHASVRKMVANKTLLTCCEGHRGRRRHSLAAFDPARAWAAIRQCRRQSLGFVAGLHRPYHSTAAIAPGMFALVDVFALICKLPATCCPQLARCTFSRYATRLSLALRLHHATQAQQTDRRREAVYQAPEKAEQTRAVCALLPLEEAEARVP
jgi:hypothetical protein